MKTFEKKLCTFLEKFSTYFAALGSGINLGGVLASFFALLVGRLKWDKLLPTWFCTLIAVILFLAPLLFLLIAAYKLEKKLKMQGISTVQGKKSRSGTFFLLGTPAFLLITGGVFISFHLENAFLLLPGLFLFLFILFLSLFRPFEMDMRRGYIKGFSFVFSLGIFLISALILGRTGKEISYTGNNVNAIKRLSPHQKKICFPQNAKNIKLTGSTMSFEYTCIVEEKDFYKYKAASTFEFKKEEKSTIRTVKAPYYISNNRHKNGGGFTFIYSLPEKKFFGSYSHH